MKTGLLSVLVMCGFQSACLAQLGLSETDEASATSGNTMEEILDKDFFDVQRPKTLRAAPTNGSTRSVSAASPGASGSNWDYRFDAQYQSTVKPYVRWYMRNDPNRPGERYLPRYMTSQGANYSSHGYGYAAGYSAHGATCGCSTGGCSTTCGHNTAYHAARGCVSCGSGDTGSQGFGYQRRSPYWQHLDYLQGQYGSTPARPRRRTSHAGGSTRTAASSKTGSTKTVWVSRDAQTSLVSVLFVEPPTAQAHKFFKGTATLTSTMKLAGIQWETEPDWSAEIKLADNAAASKS